MTANTRIRTRHALMLACALAVAFQGAFAQDSFSPAGSDGAPLLDCPHYTRPREYHGRMVPEVLLSGDHQAVDEWRQAQRLARTRRRRPDLLSPQG